MMIGISDVKKKYILYTCLALRAFCTIRYNALINDVGRDLESDWQLQILQSSGSCGTSNRSCLRSKPYLDHKSNLYCISAQWSYT